MKLKVLIKYGNIIKKENIEVDKKYRVVKY